MKRKTNAIYIIFALLAAAGALTPTGAMAAKISLDVPNETGRAWLEQARIARHNQDFQRALELYQRAAILPGTEEAGTVGAARIMEIMGDLDKAGQTLKDFLSKVNPFSLDAHLAMVDLYLNLDKQPQAEDELAIVTKLRPSYSPANERTAVIAYRKGNYRLTVAALTKVLERNPTHPKALELRARAYLKLAKYSSALTDYKTLQAIDPDDIDSYLSIGRIYVQLGEYDLADEFVSAALAATEVSPAERIKILLLAGNLEQLRGNNKKAVAYFKKAYDTNPSDLDLGLKLSDLYFSAHNLPLTQETLEQIMASTSGHGAAVELGLRLSDMYITTHSYPQAQQTLAKIMAASPGNEAAAKRMMELYTLLGRRDGLGVFLKNYIDTYPDKLWARSAYSKLLIEIDDVAGAQRVLEAATDKDGLPNTPEIALSLARLLVKQDRLKEVEPLLKKALEKFPKDDRLRFDLALCYEKRSEPKKAAEEYARVSAAQPELQQKAQVNLALLYEKQGEAARAANVLKSIHPTNQALADAVDSKIVDLTRTPNGAAPERAPASQHEGEH